MEHHSVDKGLTVGPDMNMKHQLREDLPVVIVEHNLLLAWVHAGQSSLGNLVPDIAGELAGVQPVPQEHVLVWLDGIKDALSRNAHWSNTH